MNRHVMPDGGKTDAIVLESRAGDDFLHSQACFSAVSMFGWRKGKRVGEGYFSPLYGKEMRKRKDTKFDMTPVK